MKKPLIPILMATALIAAACGESQADKATSQVCDARADISKQIDELKGLTLATATVDGVRANLTAIRNDLGKIKDAQGDLNSERKQQVQGANQQFGAQVTAIAQNVGSSLSLKDAGTQVKQAGTQLADSYAQTLGKVDCG
jgi:uncharacterized protein YjbJ (UPF0337 family)